MIRKSLSIVILLSMTLHCTARLGTLSFLYEQRHYIGYTVGLIAEIPIAMCASDYDFGKTLKVESGDSSERAPVGYMHAQDINLFFFSAIINFSSENFIPARKMSGFYCLSEYSSPSHSFFHPPSRG